jgi:hypothetical protein
MTENDLLDRFGFIPFITLTLQGVYGLIELLGKVQYT